MSPNEILAKGMIIIGKNNVAAFNKVNSLNLLLEQIDEVEELNEEIEEDGKQAVINYWLYQAFSQKIIELELINFLLNEGANPNCLIITKSKETPANSEYQPSFFAMLKHYQGLESDRALLNKLFARGASINAQNSHGESALHLAVKGRQLALVIRLLIQAHLNINSRDIYGLTPLHFAACLNLVEIGQLLLLNGADANAMDLDKQTALHMSARLAKAPDFSELLLRHHANPNVIDQDHQTPLSLAINKQRLATIELLLMHNAIFNNTKKEQEMELISALDHPKNEELFSLLSTRHSHTKTLYHFIKHDQHFNIKLYLNEIGILFSQTQLKVFFLFCLNNIKWKSAEIIFKYLTAHYPFRYTRSLIEQPTMDYGVVWLKNDLYLPEYCVNSHIWVWQDALRQITNLLANPKQISYVLTFLDKDIANFQPLLQIDFSKITPKKTFDFHTFKWPSLMDEQPLTTVKTYGLLRYLLRRQLIKHKIEMQNELYLLVGLVENQIVNPIVKSGALFKEHFLMGNALFHGTYSHYLQWYIISQAVEKKIIRFKNNLTLTEIFKTIVDINTPNDSSLWSKLLDYLYFQIEGAEIGTKQYNFGSPYQLHNALLNATHLPHLQGYLLNLWYKNIIKFNEFIEKKHKNILPYPCLLGGQLIAGQYANRFNLGITRENVATYYRDKNIAYRDKNTALIFSEQTGVAMKKASERFASLNYAIASQTPFKNTLSTHSLFKETKSLGKRSKEIRAVKSDNLLAISCSY